MNFAFAFFAIQYHVFYAVLSIPSIQQTARSCKKTALCVIVVPTVTTSGD